MSSNLSIFQLNMTSCMSEDAAQLYLRAYHINEWKAFNMACEYDKLLEFRVENILINHLKKFPNLNAVFTAEQAVQDAMFFIRERHYRSYFPGN